MKIRIRSGRCTGTGLCTTIAPEIFSLRNDANVTLLTDCVDGPAIALAEEAAACCPYDAIELEPEEAVR